MKVEIVCFLVMFVAFRQSAKIYINSIFIKKSYQWESDFNNTTKQCQNQKIRLLCVFLFSMLSKYCHYKIIRL